MKIEDKEVRGQTDKVELFIAVNRGSSQFVKNLLNGTADLGNHLFMER